MRRLFLRVEIIKCSVGLFCVLRSVEIASTVHRSPRSAAKAYQISISLDAAVGGDVVRDPAQVIFIISKNPFSTKPTVGIEDC